MKKITWVALSLLMVAALVLTSCQAVTVEEEEEGQTVTGQVTEKETPKVEVEVEEEKEEAPEAPTMVRNVWGDLVPEPQYGGTITLASALDPKEFDVYQGGMAEFAVNLVMEQLGIADWAISREEVDYTSGYFPLSVIKPHLAESWEQADPLTIIFHIRKGVHWQDKPPMNGREFNAYDVEFTWHRMLGLGSGYTEPSAYAGDMLWLPIESVTATDKWTVVVKSSVFDFNTLPALYFQSFFGTWIQPREVIEQYGDMQDWRNLVGTGPYELTDYVSGASLTYNRNPNYWATDERYPGYQLPFADEIRLLVIPDFSTRLAGLRSGKIAVLSVPIDQVESLQRTNPELDLVSTSPRQPSSVTLQVSETPFDDIRVRQAMQKAINLEEINNTYYKGLADSTPWGLAGPAVLGYYVPFDEWPEEVKEGYRYDPEAARQLLADAGYPNGFKTNYDISPDWTGVSSIDVAQICKTYWAEIGVDVELNVLESGGMYARWLAATYGGMTYAEVRRQNVDPYVMSTYYFVTGSSYNVAGINDPTFDQLIDQAANASDFEERMKFLREADLYGAKMQWSLYLPVLNNQIFYQPWFKGYNGEYGMSNSSYFLQYSRNWVDQGLKQEMGH